MSAAGPGRGHGVGIEVSGHVLRGVRLVVGPDDPIDVTAETPVRSTSDDRSLLDALIRLRADLEHPDATTRIATFPLDAVLRRIDVTGATATELIRERNRLDAAEGVSSTVLLDDGPRRWLLAIRWNSQDIRRLEELAERAGFFDVAVDPSPVALARVLGPDVHRARRTGPDGSFDLVLSDGVPVAAAAHAPHGDLPRLALGDAAVPAGWFDELSDPADLVPEIRSIVDGVHPDTTIIVDGRIAPPYPAHDLRSPARMCVALGAAVGAAGLAGRLRPVDVVDTISTTVDSSGHPWAIERVSELPTPEPPRISPVKRVIASALSRRRRH